jgi:hypothetical protein
MGRTAIPNLFEYEYRPPWRTEYEYEYEKNHEPCGAPTSPSVTTVIRPIRQLAHAS